MKMYGDFANAVSTELPEFGLNEPQMPFRPKGATQIELDGPGTFTLESISPGTAGSA